MTLLKQRKQTLLFQVVKDWTAAESHSAGNASGLLIHSRIAYVNNINTAEVMHTCPKSPEKVHHCESTQRMICKS